MSTSIKASVLAGLLLLLMVGLPVREANAQSKKGPALTANLDVSVDLSGTPVVVDATVTVAKFAARNNSVFASGNIVGTLTLGSTTKNINAAFDVAAAVQATCTSTQANLIVQLDQLSLDVNGTPLNLGDLTLNVSAAPGTTLGDLICSISDILAHKGSLTSLVTLLDRILFNSAPVTNISITATVVINQFLLENGHVVLDADVSGTVAINGISTSLAAHVAADVDVVATCGTTTSTLDVAINQLSLDLTTSLLGGIHLAVGGVQLSLSAPTSSDPGSLGSLICALEDVLAATTLDETALLDLLNTIVAYL
jgi:hypothetical protein